MRGKDSITFPRRGIKIAPPAMVKKLTKVVTVPEIETGKRSLAWEKTSSPKLVKKPMKKKMMLNHLLSFLKD